MTGYANDDMDWPGPPVDPPDEDSEWARGWRGYDADEIEIDDEEEEVDDDDDGE